MSVARHGAIRPRRLYVDTSAYLSILLGEDGSDELARQSQDAELLSSVLMVLEATRNLVRLARDGSLKPDQYKACVERLAIDIQGYVLRDLTLDLCRSNLMPAATTPRSLDLVHLRTALSFHAEEPLDRFLTSDAALHQAARELGLPV